MIVKPVIATNIPPKDAGTLAEAIITILRDEKLAIKMGNNGRKSVEKNYAWPRVVCNILELYRKICYEPCMCINL